MKRQRKMSPAKPQVLVEEEAELRQCALALLQLKYSQEYHSEEEEEEEEEYKEEDDEGEEEDEDKDALVLQVSKKKAKKAKLVGQGSKQNPKKKEKKVVEVDDLEETLNILRTWNETKPVRPRTEIIDPEAVGVCSELMRKQLMGSDVKGDQSRLMLVKNEVKKMMLCVFENSGRVVGTDGLEVSVYGPDGKVYEMMLKMWNKNTTPVLTSTVWNKFVADYGLMKHSDFLSVWMFRHKESGKICFAVDNTRFDSIKEKLSPRISKLVFKRN